MNHDEAQGLLKLCTKAYRQPADADDEVLWLATLGDMPFGLVRAAVVEWVRSSPYWPRPADIRERARLIRQQHDREAAKRRQLDDRARHAITAATTTPAAAGRTGANMVRHILGRLKDAGQDVAAGQHLGKERAVAVAEAALEEWLDRTADRPSTQKPYVGPATACPSCYAPHDQPAGTWCASCVAAGQPAEATR